MQTARHPMRSSLARARASTEGVRKGGEGAQEHLGHLEFIAIGFRLRENGRSAREGPSPTGRHSMFGTSLLGAAFPAVQAFSQGARSFGSRSGTPARRAAFPRG